MFYISKPLMNTYDPGTNPDFWSAMAGIWQASIATIVAISSLVAFLIQRSRNKQLSTQNKELINLNPWLDVLENYKSVWNKMEGIIEEELLNGGRIKIKNVGLDLEFIVPDMGRYLENVIVKNRNVSFSYKGLIINPDSPSIAGLVNGESNIQSDYVAASYRRLKVFKEQFKNSQAIEFDVRPYDTPLVFHGLLLCEKHLFLGFTEIQNGKMRGSDKPYIYLKYDPSITATEHYFTFYKTWFDHFWKHGQSS